MISALDTKAYALQKLFGFSGQLGRPLLNYGVARYVKIIRDLPYGPDPEQRLDILSSKRAESTGLSIVVYFHGGGWISADKRIYDGVCAELSRSGFLIFNVNYRLAPTNRFPAQLEDAAQAIKWAHDNAAHYGGDPARIVLAGDSAGAQIAAWYASALQKESLFATIGTDDLLPTRCLRGLVLFYGVYDFTTVLDAPFPFIHVYAKSFLGAEQSIYTANADLASPIRHLSSSMPPVFLCAGERDGLFAQTAAYADALQQRGVNCRVQLLPKAYRAGHGFLFFRWLKASKQAFAATHAFLRELQ